MRADGPLPITMSSWKSSIAGIQHFFDRARQAVDLVDEQHAAVVEVGEDRGEVAGPFERGTARGLHARAHLGRDDAGERGLAEARAAPRSSTWSTACPRLRDAVSMISRCSRRRGWPTNSSSRRGRSVVSSAASTGSAAGLSSSSLIVAARPASRSASRRSSSTVPSSASWPSTRRALPRSSSRARRARRAPRRARCSARRGTGDEIEVGHLEPRFQLDEQPLRGALADAGHEHERVEVVVGEAAPQRARRVHRQDRERELRADAGRPDQRLERVALVAGREPVEHHRVFAHVQVREQERVAPGIQARDRRHRHDHAVADAADLDEHFAARRALDHRPAHRADHGRRHLRGQRRAPHVAARERERVGRVGRLRDLAQVEQPGHHHLHRGLVGPPVAGDRELHLVRAVERRPGYRPAPRRRARAARLPHRDRGARVGLEQHPLHRHRGRPVCATSAASSSSSAGSRSGSASPGSVRITPHPTARIAPALAGDDAVAAAREPGVDAEHRARRDRTGFDR